MELRDVVEVIAGLDDERRAITNGVHRALDALERAVLPPERFGVTPARIEALRERVLQGLPEGPALAEIGDLIRERLIEDARLEGERLALLSTEGAGSERVRETLDRLAERLGGGLDRARSAHEQIGAVRALLARRRDVDAALTRVRDELRADEVTAELLDVTLAARHLGERAGALGAHAFLVAAEEASAESGLLAGIASNARALREALRLGRDPDIVASDLCHRAGEAGRKLWAERDEARRLLAQVERDAERRREISHGMFQAVTKATEVLDRLDRFERLPAPQRMADGALGPLKAACLEHGIISVLVGLREVTLDRADLDASISALSQGLGDLLGLLHDMPDAAERIVPAWDDIAAVDTRTQEGEWEAACREAMGVRRDAQGLLAVSPETLSVLVSADSLAPFRDRLFQRVEAKMTEVLRATERLESLDRELSSLCDEGDPIASRAIECKGALTRFIGESLHVMGECHARFRERLHSREAGFAQVEARVAPFAAVEDLAGAPPARRAATIAQTLAELRTMFAELECHVPGGGTSAAETREADARLHASAASLQERSAAALASLRRLREILLPPLPLMVSDAIRLAAALRASSVPARREVTRDQLGEALESLLHERLYHEALDLGADADARPVAALAAERNRRLLDIVGASLTLSFRLLGTLAEEHDRLASAERDAHLSWMDELVGHVRAEMRLFAGLLDAILPELPDNASRLDQHGVALGAYVDFLHEIADTEAGAALVDRHGETLFEGFEEPLGLLGTTLVDSVRPDEADWRLTGQLESLIELHDMLLVRLADESLRTDVHGRVAALRARAAALRDEILARADAEPGTRPGGLFR